mmetsp:Transcript_27485/g.58431  ORF Transcript_27485/g.58431 Transcript_27485/m.58431 type:complete len:101 (-) Transcript_27485:28-330(-)
MRPTEISSTMEEMPMVLDTFEAIQMLTRKAEIERMEYQLEAPPMAYTISISPFPWVSIGAPPRIDSCLYARPGRKTKHKDEHTLGEKENVVLESDEESLK